MINKAYLVSLLLLLLCSASPSYSALEVAQEHDGIVYFGTEYSFLHRYDLRTRTWLPRLNLNGGILALYVDETGIYASHGQVAFSFDHSGSNQTFVAFSDPEFTAIHAVGDFLYLLSAGYPDWGVPNIIQSLSKQTLVPISLTQFTNNVFLGSSVSLQPPKLFGCGGGALGALASTSLNTDGSFGPVTRSAYYGNGLEGSFRTFMFPDGARVADNLGVVYSTADLSYIGSFAGEVDDVTFYKGQSPIVLRDDVLVGYNQNLLPIGKTGCGISGAARVFSYGENLFVFAPTDDYFAEELPMSVVPVSSLQSEKPGEKVDPNGLNYFPDSIFLDRDQVFHLYSKDFQSIFRWDTKTRSYIDTIPLIGFPTHVAYSPANHTIYLAHSSGQVDQYPLSTLSGQVPFVNSPQEPLGLLAAGELLFLADNAGSQMSHYVYSSTGTLLSHRSNNFHSFQHTWNPASRLLFSYRDDVKRLCVQKIDNAGKFGLSMEAPNEIDDDTYPILVNNEGSKVVLGSGQLYSVGTNIQVVTDLGNNNIQDAVWFGDDLVTLGQLEGGSHLQSWKATNYTAALSRELNGAPLALLRLEGSLVAVTEYLNAPRFYILSTNLDLLYQSPTRPVAPSGLTATNIAEGSLKLTWNDNSDNEDGFAISVMGTVTNEWRELARVAPDTTTFIVTNLAFSTRYELRVKAFNEIGETEFAGPVAILTLRDSRIPLGPPFELRATRILGTEVHLAWRDNATNELGFRLERQIPGFGWITLTNLPTGVSNYVDTSAKSSYYYYYRVCAFSSFSDSEFSPYIQVRTLNSDELPPVGYPSALTAVAVGLYNVTLSWSENIPNEDGFVIMRGPSLYSPLAVEVGHVGPNITNFSDVTAEPLSTYWYWVGAINAFGASAPAYQSVTTPAVGGVYLGLWGQCSNILYFAFDSPLRLERFDPATTNWLEALPLTEKPTAMWLADDGVFFGFGPKLSCFDHNLQKEKFQTALDEDVRILVGVRDYLCVSAGKSRYQTIDRSSGAIVWAGTAGSWPIIPQVAVLDSGTIVTRNKLDTSFVEVLNVNQDGVIRGNRGATYPSSGGMWAFPQHVHVFDANGIVYDGSLGVTNGTLGLAGSLAGPVDDVALGDSNNPIIVRGTNLIAFSSSLLETGRTSVPRAPAKIFAYNNNVYSFFLARKGTEALEVEVFPLADLKPLEPGPDVKFYGARFRPEDVFVDKLGTVNLYSAAHKSIFRWSTVTREPLLSIPLVAPPTQLAYSPSNHSIYTGYSDGQIKRIRLSESNREVGFANVPGQLLELEAADPFLFVLEHFDSPLSYSTYTPDGQRFSSKVGLVSRDHAWSPTNRRMYYFSQASIPPFNLSFVNIESNGDLLDFVYSPFTGYYIFAVPPIRVSPDGRTVVLGSGQIFDAANLVLAKTLPTPILDAAWRGRVLYTLRETNGSSLIETWSDTYLQTNSKLFEGEPLRILNVDEGLVLITIQEEQPGIRILADNLDLVYDSPINRPPTAILLSPAAVVENAAPGTVVGSIIVDDPNKSDRHRFELDPQAAFSFFVETNTLIMKGRLDYELATSVTLNVKAIDPYGLAFTKDIVVEIVDTNEPPTNITLSSNSVPERLPVGSLVALVSVSDPDRGDTARVELLSSAEGKFELRDNRLILAKPLVFAEARNHKIRIRAVDSGGLKFEKELTLAVEEYFPPPPMGAVFLTFEQPITNSTFTGTNWNESGFVLFAPKEFSIQKTTNEIDAFNETSTLRLPVGNELVIRHRLGLPFLLHSFELAESYPTQNDRTVQIRGTRAGQSDVQTSFDLDAVGDGFGPLLDFQTVYPTDDFADLSSVSIVVPAGGAAIDNIVMIVGETHRTFVSIRPNRAHGWELNKAFDDPPFRNAALFSLERYGPANSGLQCKLNFEGSATFLADYFLPELGFSNVVSFVPGQKSVPLKLVPLEDSFAEPPEVVRVGLTPSPDFSPVFASAMIYIHDTPMAAWFASEYPLLEPKDAPTMDPLADPDGNGFSNIAEFVMGIRAADGAEARPLVIFTPTADGTRVDCNVNRNPMADGLRYALEETSDLRTWRPVSPHISADYSNPALQRFSYSFELPRTTEIFIRLSIVSEEP